MSSLSSVRQEAYQKLLASINSTMTGLAPQLSLEDSNGVQILMMETDLEVAGFGILFSQDPENEYESLYSGFKKIYSTKRKSWARHNLSFVLCRPDNLQNHDELFNSVQNDLYFCRKFVISSEKKLTIDLESLPFIPLERESVVIPRRPVSAQSILQRIGTSDELAKHISLPNTRNSISIVEDCLTLSSVPDLKKLTEDIYQKGKTEAANFTRLKSLVINDFRAYRGKHEFDLDADLIILYGPNGMGKTSFFDAVDFACTGGCGRFKNLGGDTAFRKKAHHLDADSKNTFVQLNVSSSSEDVSYKRNLTDASKALVNKASKDRTNTLFSLTGITGEEFEKRVESIVNLFRATHLFGQDFQTLTEDFGKTSELSLEIVSRMLAFQDYVRSDQKITEVIAEFQQRLKQSEEKNKFNIEKMNEIKLNRDQLQDTAVILNSPKSLEDWFSSIIDEMKNKVDLPVPDKNGFTKGYIRSVRSVVEANLKELTNRTESISDLEPEVESLLESQKTLVELDSKLKLIEKELERVTLEAEKIRTDMLESEILLKTTKHNEANSISEIQNIQWLIQNRIQYERYSREVQLNKSSTLDLLNEIQGIAIQSLALENELLRNRTELNKYDSDLKSHVNLVKSLELANTNMPKLRSLANELADDELQLGKLELSLLESSKSISDLPQRVVDIKKSRSELDLEIKELLKNESALTSLVESLKVHVSDGHCPACGVDHKTKDNVIRLFTERSNVHSKDIAPKSANLAKMDDEIKILESQQKILEDNRLNLESQVKKTKVALTSKAKAIQELRDNLIGLGFRGELDQMGLDLAVALARKVGATKGLEDLLSECVRSQQELIKKTDSNKTTLDQMNSDLKNLQSKETTLEQEIQKILTEGTKRGLSFDANSDQLINSLPNKEVDLAETRSKLKDLENLHKELEKNKESTAGVIKSFAQSKSGFSSDIAKLQKRSDSVIGKLKALSFPEDCTVSELKNERSALVNTIATRRSSLNEISTIETAISSAEVSAEVSRLNVEYEKTQVEIAGIQAEIEKFDAWSGFFKEIKTSLSGIRNNAVSEFTEKYGPLSSTIQARLRSVYGFGDLKLVASKGAISVTVKRAEKELRPIDFFSESQKQILVLSLFFASSITQNWSSFAPIFLDDPVTHFDDLNAYAFLDLISGMLQSEKGRRQFVISTCEEKLFQLMRQKFYSFGNRVRIFQFSSIGENGPVWSQIPNGATNAEGS